MFLRISLVLHAAYCNKPLYNLHFISSISFPEVGILTIASYSICSTELMDMACSVTVFLDKDSPWNKSKQAQIRLTKVTFYTNFLFQYFTEDAEKTGLYVLIVLFLSPCFQ